jgi:hypothetical protein
MAILTEAEVRVAATRFDSSTAAHSKRADAREHYDVFLSHAFLDAELVRGTVQVLKEAGLTVYVDWLDEPELDRSRVNHATARLLRARMKLCDALIVAYSANSVASKWVQWELGYFDGLKGRVAVFPIAQGAEVMAAEGFEGHEYFQLYPSVMWDPGVVNGRPTYVLVAGDGSMQTGMMMGDLVNWTKDGSMPGRRDPPLPLKLD